MTIFDILTEINSDNGRIYKTDTVKKYAHNALFKRVLDMAYNPNYVYYIKDIDIVLTNPDANAFTNGLDVLVEMSARTITGSAAKAKLQECVAGMTPHEAIVFRHVIDRDLKCGFGSNTINDAIPNFIPETPYMGASSFSEKKARKLFEKGAWCYADLKMDGRYVNTIIHPDGLVEMVSRQGKRAKIDNPILIEEARRFGEEFNTSYLGGGKGIVLNGEMIIPSMPRYQSNGIISSLVSIAEKEADGEDVTKEKAKFLKKEGISYDGASSMIDIVIWDYVPLDIYKADDVFENVRANRFNALTRMVENTAPDRIRIVDTTQVKTYEEARNVFQAAINRGEEGIILKASGSFWKSGKGTQQIKMKLEFTCDLEVIGFNEGKEGTKYIGSLGSFQVKSCDSLLFTDPAGIGDKERAVIWNDRANYLGKIIQVKCNGLSHDSDGNYSLLHPVYNHVRTDKSKADSLDEIKNIQAMIVGLS
jgi:hypothetical protein